MPDATPPILPYEPATGVAKLVNIGPFRDLIEANLAVGLLQDEGIRASLAGENVAAALGPVYGAAYAGGPTVLVPEEDEADARRIIRSIQSVRRDRLAAETPPCPFCQHRPTHRVIHGLRWIGLAVMAAALFTIPLTAWGFALFAAGVLLIAWPATPAWRCPPAASDSPPPSRRLRSRTRNSHPTARAVDFCNVSKDFPGAGGAR